MSQWPMVRLGDLCNVNPGLQRANRPKDQAKVSFVPMAAVDETGGVILSLESRNFAEVAKGYTAFQDGDVLFAKITPCMENGKAAIATGLENGLGFGSTEFYVLRPTERVLSEFIFYFIRQPSFRAKAKANFSGTAGQQRVPKGFLEDFPIPLPPLDEQRRIVDVLNRADSIRRLRKQALETTRELIPALFVDMFGDPATNPKGWEVRPLGEVVAGFEGGKNLQAGDDGLANPFRILKVSAVTSGHFRPDEAKPAPDGYIPPANHFVRKGDLLFSRANTVELVGATALVEEDYANLLLPDKLWRFVWHKPSPVVPAYIQYFLQSRYVRQELGRLATGTSDSMRNISQAKLKTLPVPIPPTALQRAFAAHVDSALALSKQQNAHYETSERFLQSLMAQYFE